MKFKFGCSVQSFKVYVPGALQEDRRGQRRHGGANREIQFELARDPMPLASVSE